MSALGDLLKNRRVELKKTMQQAVRDCGGGLNLYRIEKGELKKPSAETLVKLSKGYDLPLDRLQEFSNVPLSKVRVVFKKQENLMPLIKVIALCGLSTISRSDIDFLVQTQSGLQKPMDANLVKQLLVHRSKEKGGEEGN